MSFIIIQLMGDDERDPLGDAISRLLDEVENADEEHTDVSISHESGWSLSIFRGGYVLWKNLDERGGLKRHMTGLPRDEVLRIANLVAQGRLAELENEPWKPGYAS